MALVSERWDRIGERVGGRLDRLGEMVPEPTRVEPMDEYMEKALQRRAVDPDFRADFDAAIQAFREGARRVEDATES